MSIPVFYEVFRTRYEGEKLPNVEAVKHTRRVGDLTYMERIFDPRPGRSIFLASLLQPDGETYVIPPLDRARLRRIKGGILISGMEVITRGIGMKRIKSDDYPQTWFCRPIAIPRGGFDDDEDRFGNPAEARRLARERELEESLAARKIGETMTKRADRRVPHNPETASGRSPGYF
ncbi:hypothetical protein FHT32_001291 [Variovorax sp. SG517]|uniref:hypothetical protein n=1 Tax=Variovorax sp. SG517 TaxID=2587117 RepID=UPI00159DD736|nr:hypothetical protein [Variovorax sp. SG517]NVM87652.1 hypothetical protein [Variovorax sp. SG517]